MSAELYAAGVPVVVGQVEMVKRFMPDRWHKWLPVVAVALGVLWGFMLPARPVVERIFAGAAAGLGAAGAFDGTRAVMEKPPTVPTP